MKHSRSRRGEDFFERRELALKRQESRIRRRIDALKENRRVLRKERSRQGIPSVAVVGYTNCGKTSLIRAVTGSEALVPRNQARQFSYVALCVFSHLIKPPLPLFR